MSKTKVFVGIALFFALGVFMASRFILPEQAVLIVMAAAAVFFALTFSLQNKTFRMVAVFLFAAGLGALRLQGSLQSNQYREIFDSKQKLEGYIVEDVDIRQTFQFLTVQPKGFNQRVLVTAPLSVNYFYGDWIVIDGKVLEPQNFDDFDYQKYLERFNVYAAMKYPKILMLKSHQQSPLKESLLRIKLWFTNRVNRLLPQPQSSLLTGILIGARKTLPTNIVDNFNATGTSHIIAISGYNISIIISWLGFLAFWPGRRARFWLTLGFIVAFVILSGASASVVRAAVMGFLILIAANIGRQYSVGPALFFAGLVMLIINPKILFWDVSFQLSFLATLGIVYFMPVLEKLTLRWPSLWNLKIILLTTFSAIIATLPLILFTFGRLSLVAPLVNLLVLPVLPLVMILGFASALPLVGQGCAFAAGFLLKYILSITAAFAHVPYSNLSIKISQYIFILLSVAVIALYFGLKRLMIRRQKLHS